MMKSKSLSLLFLFCLLAASLSAQDVNGAGIWQPVAYPEAEAYAPSPLPDRIVLTWDGDPATSQAVTWRTDTSVQRAWAELALAGDDGRAMEPARYPAKTTELLPAKSE